MKMPFVQSALVVDVTQQTDTASNLTAVSADQQQVNTTITVNYRWNNNKLPEIYKNIKLDVSRVLQQRVSEAVKSTTAKYSAYDLIAKREAVREEIQVKLHAELLKYDITLDAMQIVDFRFSKEYEAAIEAKMTADQVAKKAEMDLKRIEVEARQRITQAQAEAEAIRIQAEAVKSQGEGCDHTIGCNHVNVTVVGQNLEHAKQLLMSKLMSDYGPHKIDSVKVYVVADTFRLVSGMLISEPKDVVIDKVGDKWLFIFKDGQTDDIEIDSGFSARDAIAIAERVANEKGYNVVNYHTQT